jgi:hypothetical protein
MTRIKKLIVAVAVSARKFRVAALVTKILQELSAVEVIVKTREFIWQSVAVLPAVIVSTTAPNPVPPSVRIVNGDPTQAL